MNFESSFDGPRGPLFARICSCFNSICRSLNGSVNGATIDLERSTTETNEMKLRFFLSSSPFTFHSGSNERMVKEVGPRQAFRNIFRQQTLEKTSHLRRNRFGPFDRFFADHFDQMKNVVREERRFAVIHFVENAAQRPGKASSSIRV